MNDSESRFWFIGPGLILPEAAVVAALDLERAGHQLLIDGDDVLIERGPGCPPIAPELIEAARRWKGHIWLLVHHVNRDAAPARDQARHQSEATR